MRRLPRIQRLRALQKTPATPSAPFRYLSTSRPAPFRASPCRPEDKKQRQEILEALERDRQSAISLQSESELVDAEEYEPSIPCTRIVVPPDFSYAPSPKHAADYVPAKSVEELEEVGGVDQWWEEAGHWGEADVLPAFSGRTGSSKVLEPSVLEVLVRQAVVEALVVQGKAGEEMLMGKWEALDKAAMSRAVGVEVAVSESGDVTLNGDLSGVLAGLSESEPASELESEELVLTGEEAREILKSGDRAWRNVPITNPALKFAIHKRVYQLTGHYLADAKLAPLRTAQHLLTVLSRPATKPKKVLEEIQSPRGRGSELLDLPNVKVYNRRVTPIDKEVWVGRWKVIEDELVKRGLPVTGTGGVGKAREKDWLMGKP
ncbi:uncharacterized protein DNG_10200 [Cephalotrichum gorgonifer]|uniref:Large ribosomal subunit protein mL50 n=1 Tax=Cephalotrichum gorgonifer TaxID=2041049 RepID=A0AAE8N763_9PEZI|nr:uncharacterized protein DNG_10200 [Cephalotrichum gorgonifer]